MRMGSVCLCARVSGKKKGSARFYRGGKNGFKISSLALLS